MAWLTASPTGITIWALTGGTCGHIMQTPFLAILNSRTLVTQADPVRNANTTLTIRKEELAKGRRDSRLLSNLSPKQSSSEYRVESNSDPLNPESVSTKAQTPETAAVSLESVLQASQSQCLAEEGPNCRAPAAVRGEPSLHQHQVCCPGVADQGLCWGQEAGVSGRAGWP